MDIDDSLVLDIQEDMEEGNENKAVLYRHKIQILN